MTGLLPALAPARLATVVVQAPAAPTASCLPPQAHIDDATSRWYCGRLAAAGNGRLEGPTAYRLAYFPTFRRWKLVEVRQERSGRMVQTTIMSGFGGYPPPGDIHERRQRWLTPDDVLDLDATVKRSGVWRPDMRQVNYNVVHESGIFLEAVQPGTHRVHITGASLLEGQPLHDLVELLRTLAGIDHLEK